MRISDWSSDVCSSDLVTSAMVFCRSREGLASPDLQLLFTPASYDVNRVLTLEHEPGVSLVICPTRPASRGTVLAATPDPLARPVIRPNYMADPEAVRVMLAGMEHARRIYAAPALAELGRASCRGRVCSSVSISVGAVSLKN